MEFNKWTRVKTINRWDNNKTANIWKIIMLGIHRVNWSTRRELLDQLVPVLSHQITSKTAPKQWPMLRMDIFRKIFNKHQILSRWEVAKLGMEFQAWARQPSTLQRRVSPVFSRWLTQGNNKYNNKDRIQVVRETWISFPNYRIINRACCIGRIRRWTKNRMPKAIRFLDRAPVLKSMMSHWFLTLITTDTPIKLLWEAKDHKLCTIFVICPRLKTFRIIWVVKMARKSAPLWADLEEWETQLDRAERPLQAPNHEYLWEVKELQEQVLTPHKMSETHQTPTERHNHPNFWHKLAKNQHTIKREFKIPSITEIKTSQVRPT